jgi:hypothetical protein
VENAQVRGGRVIRVRSAAKYFPLIFSLLCSLLPVATLAQNNHPSCRTDYNGNYTCTPPSIPPTPTISPSPSTNGSYTVSVYNTDPYSWIVLSSGESSRGCFCTNPTFTFTGRPPGQYTATARRCLTDGSKQYCSSYSPIAYVTVLGPPSAPSVSAISGASACSTSISVSWSPGAGYPAGSTAYYDVQELDGSTWTQIYTDTTLTSRSRGVSETGTYRHAVRSRYYFNGAYGPYSDWTYNSQATVPACLPGAPGVPSLSHVNPDTGTNVSISWSPASVAVGTVQGYRVQRSGDGVTWTTLGGACLGNITSCTDSDPHTRGTTYYYRVQAYKSTGDGPWSSSASVGIRYGSPSTPATPGYTAVSPFSYTVNWSGGGNANSGAISYIVWERVAGGSWTNVGSGTHTSQSFSGRSAATLYEYMVRACNANSPQQCTDSYNVERHRRFRPRLHFELGRRRRNCFGL